MNLIDEHESDARKPANTGEFVPNEQQNARDKRTFVLSWERAAAANEGRQPVDDNEQLVNDSDQAAQCEPSAARTAAKPVDERLRCATSFANESPASEEQIRD